MNASKAKTPPTRRLEPCEMLVIPLHRPEADLIGLQAVPGRMPQVLRLPGESFKALTRRALHSVTGRGVLLVSPLFKD